MNYLSVSPHPDDTELGIGGLVHKLTSVGHTVDIAVVTGTGNLSMLHSGQTVSFQQRMTEQGMAANVLGINKIHYLDFAPASRFDEPPKALLVSKLDQLFPKYDKVFIPLPSYNQDHTIVWEACLAATRPGRVDSLEIWAYEQPMQGHGPCVTGMFGKRYVRLDEDDLTAKAEALLCHKSQISGREHSLTGLAGMRTLAAFRGAECGASSYYAELTYLVRSVV